MTLFIGSLQLGLLYGVMVLGIYISFRILNIPDLTAEGRDRKASCRERVYVLV